MGPRGAGIFRAYCQADCSLPQQPSWGWPGCSVPDMGASPHWGVRGCLGLGWGEQGTHSRAPTTSPSSDCRPSTQDSCWEEGSLRVYKMKNSNGY